MKLNIKYKSIEELLFSVDVLKTVCLQAFGISEEEIIKYVGNGIIRWGQLVTDVVEDIELRINQTRNSETTSLVTVLLEGIVHYAILSMIGCVSSQTHSSHRRYCSQLNYTQDRI